MPARVLVVDDEPSIRKVLSVQLGRAGFEITTAEDGAKGVDALQADAFDVVVTDLRMPELDGLGLLRWVRTHQANVPVIVITAHGSVDTAVEALKQGAFDYVTKPFDQEELRGTIESALDEAADSQPPSNADLGLKEYVRVHTERLERHRIRQALDDEEGNVTRAAKRLGISRRSLQTKMKDYGLREH